MIYIGYIDVDIKVQTKLAESSNLAVHNEKDFHYLAEHVDLYILLCTVKQ